MLGIDPETDAFRIELLTHINTSIMTLQQIGVGPTSGFIVTGSTESWEDYLGANERQLEGVKSYIYLKVKEMFDPPASSTVFEAMRSTISELEWRLNIQKDNGGM